MAVPFTNLAALRVLLQIQQNLIILQSNMRNNASTWLQQAQAQSVPAASIAAAMNTAAGSYQTRLAWIPTLQADPNYPAIVSMAQVLGITQQDVSDTMTPLQAVANQLGPATKDTYAQQITICNQIIAAINAPLSLWPE